MTEQLNEERAARYVAEQRLKELEDVFVCRYSSPNCLCIDMCKNNNNDEASERDRRGEDDDMETSLSTSLRDISGNQKFVKQNLSVLSDLAFERLRSEKQDTDGAENLDSHESMRRKDLLENDECVRRSAPPDSEMWSEHMRPSLSARSA